MPKKEAKRYSRQRSVVKCEPGTDICTDAFDFGRTSQEYAEKLLKLSNTDAEKMNKSHKHIFSEYAENWFELYSLPNIEKATAHF